jgi:hypothetical protein
MFFADSIARIAVVIVRFRNALFLRKQVLSGRGGAVFAVAVGQAMQVCWLFPAESVRMRCIPSQSVKWKFSAVWPLGSTSYDSDNWK